MNSKLKKRKSVKIFKSVIFALFLREVKARFTSSQAGVFWTFFQPFITIFIFVYIHAITRSSEINANATIEYSIFLTAGIIPFFLFKSILLRSVGAFSANRAIFIYKQIKPIDTIFARVVSEYFFSSAILIFFLLIAYFLNYDIKIKNLPMFAFAYLWLIIFAFAWGLLLAIINSFYDWIKKLLDFSFLPLLLLSGVFFSLQTVADISPSIAKLLLYNPLIHFMELIHGSVSYSLDTKYVDYNYMLFWTFIPMGISLWLYIKIEKRIISSR